MKISYLASLAVLLCTAGVSAAQINGKALWKKSIEGRKNLAAGKVLSYSPAPSYRLTVDKKDNKDLTDGKLSRRKDDRIWFDRNAVGWRTNEIYITLDLGSEQDLDKAVLRTQGGARRFYFPDKIESFVSKDGKIWHRSGSLSRLQPGEMTQHDNINFFYYDESSPTTVPLYLNLQARARYVLLKVHARGFFFTDELAVLAAEKKSKSFNEAFTRAGEELPVEGFICKVRTGKLFLSDKYFMPQFFVFSDLRVKKNKKSKVVLTLELPEAVELHNPDGIWSAKKKGRMNIWSRKIDINNRNYQSSGVMLRSKGGKIAEKGYIYTSVDSVEQFKFPLKIETAKFPEVPAFKKLHISLAWISEDAQRFWPDFFKVWKSLGFNNVSAFPLHRKGGYTPEILSFLDEARKNDMKVIMNLSPVIELARTTPKKDLPSLKCSPKGFNICPAYFGKYWKMECDRLTDYVKLLKPDYVFFDIESWPEAYSKTKNCNLCKQGAAAAGVDRGEFLLQCGKRHVADLHKAVQDGAKAANIKMPEIGSYNRSPVRKIYQITRFTDEYPKYTNMAQPSLYVAGNAEKVHAAAKQSAEAMNYNKKLIVFLTAGTYGEFDPEKIEPMILESFLNGAGGITYFKYANFDTPEDFYYHASALAKLHPYEDLIAAGKPVKLASKPSIEMLSALQYGNEILLLAGNYSKNCPKLQITLPGKAVKVYDAANKKALAATGKTLTLDIPDGKFRLIYVKLAR